MVKTVAARPSGVSRSVLTIHNIGYQGVIGAAQRDEVLPAGDAALLHQEDLKAGRINLLRQGVLHADLVTTVSPTYAREILTAEGGFGLEGVLRFRAGDLVGILNGIDADSWDPAHDRTLPANYSATDLRGKARCKAALQRHFQLEENPVVPLFGVVSRLVAQKGLDLLAEVLPAVMDRMAIQLVLLGSGDGRLENTFKWAAQAYRGRASPIVVEVSTEDDGVITTAREKSTYFVPR